LVTGVTPLTPSKTAVFLQPGRGLTQAQPSASTSDFNRTGNPPAEDAGVIPRRP